LSLRSIVNLAKWGRLRQLAQLAFRKTVNVCFLTYLHTVECKSRLNPRDATGSYGVDRLQVKAVSAAVSPCWCRGDVAAIIDWTRRRHQRDTVHAHVSNIAFHLNTCARDVIFFKNRHQQLQTVYKYIRRIV